MEKHVHASLQRHLYRGRHTGYAKSGSRTTHHQKIAKICPHASFAFDHGEIGVQRATLTDRLLVFARGRCFLVYGAVESWGAQEACRAKGEGCTSAVDAMLCRATHQGS